jgi:hypothetical protein
MPRQQIARPDREAGLGLGLVLEAQEVGVEGGERLDVGGPAATQDEAVAEIAEHTRERTTPRAGRRLFLDANPAPR